MNHHLNEGNIQAFAELKTFLSFLILMSMHTKTTTINWFAINRQYHNVHGVSYCKLATKDKEVVKYSLKKLASSSILTCRNVAYRERGICSISKKAVH